MKENTHVSPPTTEKLTGGESYLSKWGGEDFHYRALFEQAGDCVFIISLELKYITVNQQAANLLGYTQDELIGMSVNDIIKMDEFSNESSLVTDGVNLLERILRRKDGSTVPVEISTTLIYNDAGIPAYVQSIARDITERKKNEKSIQLHNRILGAINTAAAQLLQSSNIETSILEVLSSLGNATGVSFCLLFEISTSAARSSAIITYFWNKPGAVFAPILAAMESCLDEIQQSGDGIFLRKPKLVKIRLADHPTLLPSFQLIPQTTRGAI